MLLLSFFFCCCLGNFVFILFYSEYLFFIGTSSVRWLSLRLRTWVPVRRSRLFEEFPLCVSSLTHHSDAGQHIGPSSTDSKHHGRSSGRTHWSEKALQYTKRVLWSPRVDNHHTQFEEMCVRAILHYSGKNFTWRAWACMSVVCVY